MTNGKSRKARNSGKTADGANGSSLGMSTPSGTTGRHLILMRRDAVDEGVKAIHNAVGVKLIHSNDIDKDDATVALTGKNHGLVLDNLAVAVVAGDRDQINSLSAKVGEDGPILAIEEERFVYALQARTAVPDVVPVQSAIPVGMPSLNADMPAPPLTPAPIPGPVPMPPPAPLDLQPGAHMIDYLRGYRDAVDHLIDKMLDSTGAAEGVPAQDAEARLETDFTWGLRATRVPASRFSGRGIKVAVLDTGLDLNHPDFAGRRIRRRTFVSGQAVQDGMGHGTHCIGTACGPQRPGVLPRYGVAFNADIFVGKVLSNQGSGTDMSILRGIEWAVANKCAVVSMSLGAPTQIGQGFSQVYETVAQRALLMGTLIVAAAGNESHRPGQISPVGHPANCPSIMAVGAIDQRFAVAFFSCGGINPNGGQVDIAGPGVQVRSSWPQPARYNTISGTSMATPHVAGIAALYAEMSNSLRGHALWNVLTQRARRMSLPARDIGAGLVQAP
jgi:subtilisin